MGAAVAASRAGKVGHVLCPLVAVALGALAPEGARAALDPGAAPAIGEAAPAAPALTLEAAGPGENEEEPVRVSALEPSLILHAPILSAQREQSALIGDRLAGVLWFLAFLALVVGSAVRIELRQRRRRRARRRMLDAFGG